MARGDNDHWMEDAFKNAHGQVKNRAKASGESTGKYVETHKGNTLKQQRQNTLAKTALRINRGRRGG